MITLCHIIKVRAEEGWLTISVFVDFRTNMTDTSSLWTHRRDYDYFRPKLRCEVCSRMNYLCSVAWRLLQSDVLSFVWTLITGLYTKSWSEWNQCGAFTLKKESTLWDDAPKTLGKGDKATSNSRKKLLPTGLTFKHRWVNKQRSRMQTTG